MDYLILSLLFISKYTPTSLVENILLYSPFGTNLFFFYKIKRFKFNPVKIYNF
jgi:hypothetical protein